MNDTEKTAGEKILRGAAAGAQIRKGVHLLSAQGHVLVVELPHSVLMVDCGRGGEQTRALLRELRNITDKPIETVCYSHGHGGYNFGVPAIRAHNHERGDAPPTLVAQRNVKKRYDRYRATEQFQRILGQMQFPGPRPKRSEDPYVDPDITFGEHLILHEKSPRVELLWVPSETDDALAVWLPETRVLYGGAATPGDAIPNIGTPLRTQRLTLRWAESLERMAALRPEVLLTEFGAIIDGESEVQERLHQTAKALRWLRDEVVSRLNQGLKEEEILADLSYPPELFEVPWMTPNYGSPDYIVRDLIREESGWWDRNPTSLHPAHPDEAAQARFYALSEPEKIIAKAKALAADGEIQLALHVVDLVAEGPGANSLVQEARLLKAELCRLRAKEIRPYVSKALYLSSADLLETDRSWKDLA